jgi:hypothetical protein
MGLSHPLLSASKGEPTLVMGIPTKELTMPRSTGLTHLFLREKIRLTSIAT